MAETYDGTEGDDALAADLPILDGNEDWRDGWKGINKTRDLIVWALNQAKAYADGLIGAISLSWASISGKPSTFPPSSHTHTRVESGGQWFGWQSSGQFGTGDSVSVGTNLGVDDHIYVGGHVYVPNSTAAVSGFTIAYINGPDGRLSRGASSLKYKNPLGEVNPASLGDLFAELNEFTMKEGDDKPILGYYAEQLAESEDLERFVVYGEDGPESIDFIQLLIAQNAQLNERDVIRTRQLAELADRVAALEGSG